MGKKIEKRLMNAKNMDKTDIFVHTSAKCLQTRHIILSITLRITNWTDLMEQKRIYICDVACAL